MVEQSGEPLLLPFLCCLPHTVQPLGHALPALCRVHVRLNDVLLRLCPSLPSLRGKLPSLVRLVHRLYGTVRLLRHVHVRIAACGLRGPSLIVRPRRAGDLPVLVHVVSQRARVLRLPRTDSPLAISVAAVLPSSYSEWSRHPDLRAFRSSIVPPTYASIYASRNTSRCPQDSRPGWIRYFLSRRALASPTTCRFSPAHSGWPVIREPVAIDLTACLPDIDPARFGIRFAGEIRRHFHAPQLFGTFFENILCDRQGRESVRPTCVEGQMRDNFRGLCLRQAAVHCPIEVVRDLRNLAGSNERAHSNQASIPWPKIRTQPQVQEQNVRSVLHDSRSHVTELLFNIRCSFCLRGLVERKKRRRGWWKLIKPNLTICKDTFRDGNCRHRIFPAGVKGKMRDDFRNLSWFNAIVECNVEVVGHLDRLVSRDQGGNCNHAAVSWRQAGTFPQLSKRALCVLLKGWRYHCGLVQGLHRF